MDSLLTKISSALGIELEQNMVICRTAEGSESDGLYAVCSFCKTPQNKQQVATFIIPTGYVRWSFQQKSEEGGQDSHARAEWNNTVAESGEIRMMAGAYPPLGYSKVTVLQVMAIRREVADLAITKGTGTERR
jgi:hypothetical protein